MSEFREHKNSSRLERVIGLQSSLRLAALRLVSHLVAGAMVIMLALPALGQDKEKITMWTGGGVYFETVQSFVPELLEAFPNLEFELVNDPRSPDRLLVALASGVAPDIVTQSTRNAPQFIATGSFLPVDFEAIGVKDQAGFEELYFPGSLGTLLINGKAYYLPTEVTTFATFLNRDMLNSSGVGAVPETWEGIRELGRRLSQLGPDGGFTREGVAIQRGGVWNAFHIVSMLRQLGIDWISEEGTSNFLDERAIAAFEVYASIFLDGAANPRSDWTAFRDARAAIYPGASYQHRQFTMAERATIFEVEVAPYPRLESGTPVSPSYAWGFFVTNQSRNPQLAWKVAHFLTGPRFAERWFRQASYLIPHRGDWLMEIYQTEPSWREFLDALNHAQVELSHPKYGEIVARLGAAESRIVLREMDLRPSLEILNHELNVILEN